MTASAGEGSGSRATGSRKSRVVQVQTAHTLDGLVGAHPEALRDIYCAASVADPTVLGGAAMGKMLAIEPWAAAFVATRPIVRAISRVGLWSGKSFESGGTSGTDSVLGASRFRFRCEAGDSQLDGRPTLILRYDELDNPWPISACVCELRSAGASLCVGPAWLGGRLWFWWGLDARGI